MSLRLTLLSHGATDATRKATFPLDEPLEPRAYKKAASFAEFLERTDAAWTSPALRAVQTAEALGLDASVDPLLKDIDLGRWAGMSLSALAACEPTALADWTNDPSSTPHGGESVGSFLQRIASWMDGVRDRRGRLIVVTHPAVIRAAVVAVLGANPETFWRIDVAPLTFSRFQAHDAHWTIHCLNATMCVRPA